MSGLPHSSLERQRRRAAWLFLLPMLVVLAGVAGWPLFRTVFFSFTDATLATLDGFQGVGLDNYLWLMRDPVWWRAVWNTLVFTVVSVGIETALGLGIALILNAHLPGRGLLRAAVLIPWAIPTVVSAQMWGWMFHDLYGVVNAALMGLGLIAEPRAWTADPDLALPVVIVVDVWKSTPFMALLILAALQMLPRDLYEAARVDGVHPVKVFVRITLPLIRPALMVAVLFRTLDALRVFDLMYVLTGNSRSTMSMSVYARQYLIDFQDVGYGSAAATVLVLVLAVATVLAVTLGRVRVDAGR
ncbi:carbohydrate ABC transporter membrane protein 1 (CUT1 family) [Azospirillum brasilense]|uniref:Carbohydrate ABC transporter membrane protein 1 (CUT1 family) n=1 Tax=Azospirillum brasilense TaxID=192 RepID=A0A560BJA2_AZOBR|nr:carbohydrate ABC transporter membrane protein 1 (CUT1 family) [Azospirillum brasilense]